MAVQQLLDEFSTFLQATHDDVSELPAVQITETRRAFMAGAWTVLSLLRGKDLVHERNLLEEELRRECRAFKDAVTRGEA